MAAAYSPPSRRRRFAVWVVGFVVTGKVFHNLTERDVRRLRLRFVAVQVVSMCIVLGALAYVVTVIPRTLSSTIGVAAVGVAFGLGGFPVLLQWLVTTVLELRQ